MMWRRLPWGAGALRERAVFADPVLVRDAPSEAATLAGALQMDTQTVYNAITQAGRFAYVARGVDPDVAKALASLNLPGIGFINESRRFYPAGALAPQVVGFVGIDGGGLAGMELAAQKALAG